MWLLSKWSHISLSLNKLLTGLKGTYYPVKPSANLVTLALRVVIETGGR